MAELVDNATIAQIAQDLLEYSKKLAADAVSEEDRNSSYESIFTHSANLVNLYTQFEADWSAYNKLVSQNRSLTKKVNNLKKSKDPSLDDFSAQLQNLKIQQQEIRKSQNYVKRAKASLSAIYNEVFALQGEINKIQGIQINMAYVSNSGSENVILVLNQEEMTSNYSATVNQFGQAILRFDSTKLTNLIDEVEQKDPSRVIHSDIMPQLQNLYNIIMERYNIAKSKKSSYLFWKVNDKWQKVNRGTIGSWLEAYTSALMTGHQNELFMQALSSGDPDTQIDAFVNYFLTKVTNQSGFLEEDVEYEDNKYYGVKSGNASLLKLSNIVTLAKQFNTIYKSQKMNMSTIQKVEKAFNQSSPLHKIKKVVQREVRAADKKVMQQIEALSKTAG